MDGGASDATRFFTMAESYDRMAPLLVPCYGMLQDEMIRLVAPEGELVVVADLGAGSGILLEKVLDRCPESTACWIDYSDDFLRVARRRLERFGDRVTYIPRRLEERWEEGVAGPLDAVLSMSAIHHLTTDEKRDLYARCLPLLRSGGWMLNADEMTSSDEAGYLRGLRLWVEHVEEARRMVTPAEMASYEQWCAHFEGWKRRNIAEFGLPKAKGDDLHESFELQLAQLRDAGFTEVDLIAKFHLWCLIGGRRP